MGSSQSSTCRFKHQVNPDKTLPQEPCPNHVIRNGRNSHGKSNYCQEHKCPHDGCMYSKDFGLDCCQKHKCKISTCTNGSKCVQSYCDLHVCKLTTCSTPKLEDEEVCKDCQKLPKCQIEYCYQRRHKYSRNYTSSISYTDTISHISDSGGCFVCPEHICNTPECTEMIIDRSTFCRTHKCQRKGCSDIVTIENGWCRNHRPLTIKILK